MRFAGPAVLAILLLIGLAPAAAADHGYWPSGEVDPAAVAGHGPRTAEAADPATWGDDCTTRRASMSGARGVDVYGHVLETDVAVAVVLAQIDGVPVDGPFGVTRFERVPAGRFVWADVDGDGAFAHKHEADIEILFLCGRMPATDTVADVASQPASRPGSAVLALLAVLFVASAAVMLVLFSRRLAVRT